MKSYYQILVFLLLMLPAISNAAWKDMQGNKLEDTEWMKSSEEFGAQLLLIGDEKEFFKRWSTPSKVVNFTTIDKLYKGESLIAPIIFNGCYENSEGKCNVTVDYQVLQPNGKIYADVPTMEIWTNKPAPAEGMLELGVGYLKLVIEPEDLIGTYTVNATVTDHIKDASFTLVKQFNVSKNERFQKQVDKKQDLAVQQKLSQWFTYYYRTPHSDEDLENIKLMFKEGFFNKRSAVAPMIMFLAELFRQNETKLDDWKNTLTEVPDNQIYIILQAFWESNTPKSRAILNEWSSAKMKDSILKIQSNPPIDLKTIQINSPLILDMSWATFMASGDLQYVERIIQVLSYSNESEKKDERINNSILVGAAKWSLSSNAVQHELVYKKCQEFADSKDPNIKEAINEILTKVDEYKAQQTSASQSKPTSGF